MLPQIASSSFFFFFNFYLILILLGHFLFYVTLKCGLGIAGNSNSSLQNSYIFSTSSIHPIAFQDLYYDIAHIFNLHKPKTKAITIAQMSKA